MSIAGSSLHAGFSSLEIVGALLLLSVGVLGLAGATGLLAREVAVVDAELRRVSALQSTVERIRARPYAGVRDGSAHLDGVTVRWIVSREGASKRVTFVAEESVGDGGPASAGVGLRTADTLDYRILAP